jgi:serine/threonine protein kinase
LKEKEVLSELSSARSLIKEQMTGADTYEAKKLLEKSFECLHKGDIDTAFRLVNEAKIAAQPPPEYLIQKAREYYSEASKEFQEDHFDKAIEIWENSIEISERAKKIAEEKKDNDMIQNIENNILKSKINIEKAEIGFDNYKIGKLIDKADETIQKSDQIIDQHLYDRALAILFGAVENIDDALLLAKKRKFNDCQEKIEKRKINIEKRIEYCQLEKGRYQLENATKQIVTVPEQSEKELYTILNYLESLKMNSVDLQQLIDGCKKAIIEARLAQARKNMANAEDLYKNDKFYDAREIYENAQNYLKTVEDETGRLKVTSLLSEIRKLNGICIENRNTCNSHIFGWPDVNERILYTPKDVEVYTSPAVSPVLSPLGNSEDSDKLKELNKEYDILGKIGSGGFADVFKAKWRAKNIVVALKVPKELNQYAEDVFFREIESWNKLKHKNIVELIKPRAKPIPHLIIEYVDGPTLHKKIRDEKLDIKEACHIAFDVARGLKYAESQDIIHCDLNPKNILLSNIDAKITDYGMAKTVSTTSRRLGNPAYNAPEQLNNEIPDCSTEVYQFGLIFYEMITGVNPFDRGDEEGTKRAIKEELPQPPSLLNENAKPFDDIIMRCLAKKPDERPALHHIRMKISEYMKKCHGEELRITPAIGNESYVKSIIKNALYDAKDNNISGCTHSLKTATEISSNTTLKNKVKNIIEHLDACKEEKVEIGEGIITKIREVFEEAI